MVNTHLFQSYKPTEMPYWQELNWFLSACAIVRSLAHCKHTIQVHIALHHITHETVLPEVVQRPSIVHTQQHLAFCFIPSPGITLFLALCCQCLRPLVLLPMIVLYGWFVHITLLFLPLWSAVIPLRSMGCSFLKKNMKYICLWIYASLWPT